MVGGWSAQKTAASRKIAAANQAREFSLMTARLVEAVAAVVGAVIGRNRLRARLPAARPRRAARFGAMAARVPGCGADARIRTCTGTSSTHITTIARTRKRPMGLPSKRYTR